MAFVFKKLKPGEYRAQAFKTHKKWEFTESSVNEDIEVIYGNLDATGSYKQTQIVYNPFAGSQFASSSTDFSTVFRQIRHLYYGGTPTSGTFFVGNGHRIDNPYLTLGSSTDKEIRKLHDKTLTWISIPQLVFGEGIKRKSVKLIDYAAKTAFGESGNTILKDDGNGNLYDDDIYGSLTDSGGDVTASYVGNVFYEHGNIVITTGSRYEHVVSGSSANFLLEFSGSHTIYEHNVECTAEMTEFNFTMNPTTRTTGSDGKLEDTLIDRATGSAFVPYVTTIGLYDDYNRLLAIGKLARAIRNDKEMSLTFRISIDA